MGVITISKYKPLKPEDKIGIRIKRDTANTLRFAGRKGESYDDVIQRLIPARLRRSTMDKIMENVSKKKEELIEHVASRMVDVVNKVTKKKATKNQENNG